MRVLYYSPHPGLPLNSFSGPGTHMREMIKAFEHLGHEVIPRIMGGLEPSANALPTRYRGNKRKLKQAIPAAIWESLRDLQLIRLDRQLEKELGADIQRIKPDVIYERANYLQLSGVRSASRYGIPHVLEMNSPHIVERQVRRLAGSLLGRLASRSEAEQIRLTRKVAVVSTALKNYFVEKHGVSDNKFVVTPNAIDRDKLIADPKDVASVRLQYGLNGRFVAGFVGSIATWHRVDLLIRACHYLQADFPSLSILIVGDGLPLDDLKQLAQDLGVDERVVFTGRVPHKEVFSHIKAMDVGVLPANMWYQSPVKVFEYGAMDIPIVAPATDTMRELLVPEAEGLLVKPEVESLASALTRLIESPHEGRVMAKAFHDKVLRDYTWSRNVERVLGALGSESRGESEAREMLPRSAQATSIAADTLNTT